MNPEKEITKYAGIYNDLMELLGEAAVELIHKNMCGQQVTFPKRLYTREYVVQEMKDITDSEELKKMAVRYGYTERRLKQLIKESTGGG